MIFVMVVRVLGAGSGVLVLKMYWWRIGGDFGLKEGGRGEGGALVRRDLDHRITGWIPKPRGSDLVVKMFI